MKVRLNYGLVLMILATLSPFSGGAESWTGFSTDDLSNKSQSPPLLVTSTPRPTRTPTPTPTPTPQPTSQSSQVFNLDEIYFITGIGGGGVCGNWNYVKKELPNNTRLPYISIEGPLHGEQIVCAYGFNPKRIITFYWYTPDGTLVAKSTDRNTSGTDPLDGRGIGLSLSYALPRGRWMVVASDGRSTARNSFSHPARGEASIDVTHILPGKILNPDDPGWYRADQQGDRVAVFGVGFRGNALITVAVARWNSDSPTSEFLPVEGWNVRTDRSGEFFIEIPIDRSYRDGEYWVFANPTTGRALDDDAWINDLNDYFKVSSPYRACSSGPFSNLHKNDIARLSAGLPNNVRRQPRVTTRQIGQIQAYQRVMVMDGPICSNGMTWWYVEVFEFGAENEGLKGWTAEGDTSGDWLIPVR